MAQLLPFRSTESIDIDGPPRLVNIEDDSADDVIGALSSTTARAILSHLYSTPTTASEVAAAVDTSLQNARYHLENLKSAGLIEPADIWYSSRGTEMTVYAPTNNALVVAAGRDDRTSLLKDIVSRVLGAVALLAVVSVAVERAITVFQPARSSQSAELDVASDSTPALDPTWLPLDLTGPDLVAALSTPAVLFFAGGLLILTIVTVWWYVTAGTPRSL